MSTIRRAVLLLLLLIIGFGAHPSLGRAEVPEASSSARTSLLAPDSFITLDRAIRIALEHHPALEQTRYKSLAAQAMTKQRKGDRYPWLEASVAGTTGSLRIVTSDGRTIHDQGGHGFDPGGALPHHNQNMLTGGLILNQLITDFGYTAHRIEASQATQAASEKEQLTKKALVILNVQKTYLDCLLRQALLSIAEETVKRRTAVREQVAALHKQQLKSKVDLDLIAVEVANAELAVIETRNDLQKAFAAFNNAMGLDATHPYRLQTVSLETVPPPELETLVREGLEHRPELLGGRDKIQANEELLKAMRSLNYGSLTAVGTIGVTKYWDTHDGGIHDNEVAPFWGAGATARFPLFTGFKIQNQVSEARHLKSEAEQDLQNVANDVVLQVIRAHLTEVTNIEQIRLEQERVTVAKEALLLAQQRYRLGLSPILDVIRATTMLFEAESRLTEAQYIYKTGQVVMAYAAGQDYRRY